MLSSAPRVLFLIGLLVLGTPAFAAPVVESEGPPPEVAQLLKLMQSPAVRSWLDTEKATESVVPARSFSKRAVDYLGAARSHVDALLAAAPSVPGDISDAAAMLRAELRGDGNPWNALVLLLAFASGLLLEALFLLTTARRTAPALAAAPATRAARQSSALGAAHRLSRVAIFAVGTFLVLLLLEQPPLVRQAVVALLIAIVATRLGLMLAEFLFPTWDLSGEAISSTTRRAVVFQRRRLGLAIGIVAFGWAVSEMLAPLGFSAPAREIVVNVFGVVLLAAALEATWRLPRMEGGRVHALVRRWLLTVGLVLAWALFVADIEMLFWPVLLAFALPASIAVSRRAIRSRQGAGSGTDAPAAPSFAVVYAERAVRVFLVLGAALILAHAWGLELTALTSRDTLEVRLLRGLLSGVVILLVADLLWNLAKAFIDRTLSASRAQTGLDPEAAARHARLRTLLPILRNVLFIVIAAMAVLMALSELGVAIGPLIAGAGVVGVAVGFGAQTLVKDIISGVFYLLDDAFRVGEYVESGVYSGTVESFSIRSVRLRHPRGGVFTVPFGELGAIENLSRDWAIDKFMVNVRYDTDFAKAKKLVKEVSAALLVDPDVGPSFIEPLKLQGIQELGAYSVALRLKMTVQPGEQTTVRRKVLAMVKTSFEANGIEFPYPIVKVEGHPSEAALAAAAQQALRLTNRPAAA